ncbi:MAG: ABC transporter substrate-binding protein [Chloroflexi bacterium]|nr:ABC transporter substrate-binding protein [Chloroflexota bacterium]
MRTWLASLLLVALTVGGCASPAASPAGPEPPSAARPTASDAVLTLPEATVQVGLIAPLAGYWGIYAADALGLFAREGVKNEIVYTRSPAQSVTLLASGDLHVAVNTADNAIIAISKGADLAIVAGPQAAAMYTLIAAPGIQSVPELRGKGIAINNSVRDGIANMLRRALRHYGVGEDEVDLVMVGGTPERYTAVKNGAVAASILTQPQDVMAMAEGLPRLATLADVLGDWQNLAAIVNRSWAQAHTEVLVRWLRGFIAGQAWLQDPANRDEAVRILRAATQTSEEIAQRTYALYFEERAGQAIPPDGAVNLAGLRNVIASIEESGNFDGAPPPPVERVVDLTYWEQARR